MFVHCSIKKGLFFIVACRFLWFGLLGFQQLGPFVCFIVSTWVTCEEFAMSDVSLCPQNSRQIQFIFSVKLKPDFQFLSGPNRPILYQTYFISLLLPLLGTPFFTCFELPSCPSSSILPHLQPLLHPYLSTTVDPCLAHTCTLPSLLLIFNNNSNFTSLLFHWQENYNTLSLIWDFDCHPQSCGKVWICNVQT